MKQFERRPSLTAVGRRKLTITICATWNHSNEHATSFRQEEKCPPPSFRAKREIPLWPRLRSFDLIGEHWAIPLFHVEHHCLANWCRMFHVKRSGVSSARERNRDEREQMSYCVFLSLRRRSDALRPDQQVPPQGLRHRNRLLPLPLSGFPGLI
jgi:hypothetical protein